MKTIAYVLLIIAGIALTTLLFILVKYFYMSALPFEAKFLGTIFGGIVFTPIIGRVFYVLKDK